MLDLFGFPIYLPKNWFELENFGFSPSQEWMDRLLDFTDYIVKNYSDRCVPSLDMIARGIADLALNLLGGDRYFFEFSDHPDALKRLLAPLCDLHINWAKRQMQRIPKFHGGYCNQTHGDNAWAESAAHGKGSGHGHRYYCQISPYPREPVA